MHISRENIVKYNFILQYVQQSCAFSYILYVLRKKSLSLRLWLHRFFHSFWQTSDDGP